MNLKEFIQLGYNSEPHFVLFGNPVGHSLSPLMHNTAAEYYGLDARYYAVHLENDAQSLIGNFLKNEQLKGVNLTIPFKYDFIKYCSDLDPISSKINAVNVLVRNESKWKGYNTDVYGFTFPLKEYEQAFGGTNAIIFGSGGAAKAVAYGLNKMGVKEIVMVSRNPADVTNDVRQLVHSVIGYDEWPSVAKSAKLVVNTTPLGMKPHLGKSPVSDGRIQHLENKICYDLIYNPAKTKFLEQAEEQNAVVINGLEMLIHQGSKIFKLWTDKKFPLKLIKEKLQKELDEED